jgi:hypothetical protein
MATRKWNKAGSYTEAKPPSYKIDKAGRARDAKTGAFISKRALASRKARQGKSTFLVEYPESYVRQLSDKPDALKEVTFRVKIPKAMRGKRADAGKMIDAIRKVVKEQGHKDLPRRKGERKDRVRMFAYVEGNAIDLKTGKRIRGGTGIAWTTHERGKRRTFADVFAGAKDRIDSLYEGKTLSGDPHKRTGSGAQVMPQGPDTVYITLAYAPEEPVPHKIGKSKRIGYL